MQNLTVKDLYRVDEDNDQRFTWNINGVENEILYCKNESGICIQINTIYAKTAEERVECLRQFCEQMFGGGTLTINVQIVESHFDDYDLYLNGFAQMTTSVFTAYNPNYKNIIDAFVADPNEKTKMIDFIESKRIALLQKTVDWLAAEYTQIARTITAIDNGEWPAKYKGEYQHHLQLIEDSLAYIKNNYGLTPSQTNSATPISM